MTGEIVRNIDESAARAHANREQLVLLAHDHNRSGFMMALLLKENRDKSLYKLLDYDSFEEFIADPDLALKRSTVYKYIKQIELFMEKLSLTLDDISSIGTTRLQYIAPVVEQSPVEWLGKAKSLSLSDLLSEVGLAKGEAGGETKMTPPKIPPITPAPLISLDVYISRLRGEPCLVCGKRPVDLAHFPRTKAAGGKPYEVLPLCRGCHGELHNQGIWSWLQENMVRVFGWFYSKMGVAPEGVET